ncbi:MAG TPA: hypothetical protein VKE92_02075 [Anaerolineales bacterium]|nr:hypothetical protein [Anaerolineales bacterium]
MDNIVTKLKKEPLIVTMAVRMLVLMASAYGFAVDEETLTPIILGFWALIEVGSTFVARSQVVPNVKLINQKTGEAKTRIPEGLKEKLDGGSN